MRRLVVDCSVSAAWCLQDESSVQADQILAGLLEGEALVPSLWTAEMANVLVMAERRGRITAADGERALALLGRLPIAIEPATVETMRRVRAIAREHGLTAYDACYLELAARSGLPLATTDSDLARAAEREGVPLAIRPG